MSSFHKYNKYCRRSGFVFGFAEWLSDCTELNADIQVLQTLATAATATEADIENYLSSAWWPVRST